MLPKIQTSVLPPQESSAALSAAAQVKPLSYNASSATSGSLWRHSRRHNAGSKCWACIQEQVDTEPAGQSSSEASDSGSECSEAFYSGGEETASTINDSIGGSTIASSRVPRIGGTAWTNASDARSVNSGYTLGRLMASTTRSQATDAASSTSGGVSLPSRSATSTGRPFNKPSAGSRSALSNVATDSNDDESD
ncbi:hypothetical protein AMS68_003221 [Peltaster fructicola]|uniref:Uncharacterized protein n=1 Tax=Peltaster fructicola TaxID=286661 RepID=A0A6H0XSJ1_9PEZI|nr:hypothetical protein AMS68_003221 [Peltaster fructicola]